MAPIDNIDLPLTSDSSSREPYRDPFTPEDEGRKRPSLWGALAILVVLVAAVGYFIYVRQPVPPEAGTESDARPAAAAPARPTEPLPALDASDAFVRRLVATFSAHPQLVTWLATNDLVRTFTALVDKIGVGASPARQARIAAPQGKFTTLGSGATLRIDPVSYARYDTLAQVVDSVDANGAARAYQQLKPLMEQAYRDLGYPDGGFDKKFGLAIARLLETPVPDGDVHLQSTSVSFKFADPELERLSPPQKQLLRMGPRNMKLVQDKLRAFAKAAGL